MDYENRTDFRAFDVMVHALDNASPTELWTARATAREMAKDHSVNGTRRMIWEEFDRFLTCLIRRKIS